MTGQQKSADIFTLQVGTETTSHLVFSLSICPLGIQITNWKIAYYVKWSLSSVKIVFQLDKLDSKTVQLVWLIKLLDNPFIHFVEWDVIVVFVVWITCQLDNLICGCLNKNNS